MRRAARIAIAGEAVGVDASAPMVAIARRRSSSVANARFVVGQAEELPVESGYFSHAWTIHAFHHWSDQEAGLAELFRVLAPGGVALVVESHGRGAHAMSQTKAAGVAITMSRVGFEQTGHDRISREIVVAGKKPR